MWTRGTVAFVMMLAGCYRSHERATEDASIPRDGSLVVDAGPRDAYMPELDAAVAPPCRSMRIAGTVELGTGSSLTPRLVALPGNEVGVVYVGGGEQEVTYERFSRDLVRIAGPTVVVSDSFSWAEIVRDGDGLAIGYANDEVPGKLAHLTFEGRVLRKHDVLLSNPSVLLSTRRGFFWMAFHNGASNSLEVASLTGDGGLGGLLRIDLGAYGSGHGAVVRPDGESFVVGYPREGPHGVRRGYVAAVSSDGTLLAEEQLADRDDTSVMPLALDGTLVVVRGGDGTEMIVERRDFETLERIEERVYPPVSRFPFVASAPERFVVARVDETSQLVIDVFDADLEVLATVSAPLARPGHQASGHAISLGNEFVLAVTSVEGSESYPWLVHLACADE